MKNDKYDTQSLDVSKFKGNILQSLKQELIVEGPLLIRIEGKTYSCVMRTPGEEIPQVAGLCLAEGLVEKPEDILRIDLASPTKPNVVEVELRAERAKKISSTLEKGAQSSKQRDIPTISGEKLIDDLRRDLKPIEDATKISIPRMTDCVETLVNQQALYRKTRASHAAMLMDHQLQVLTWAEDVARRNALDKAIGKAFLGQQLEPAKVCILSSRINYELVYRVARARLPIIIGMSRPTSLAVQSAQELDITLACPETKTELLVFCCEDRFILEE